MKIFRFRHATDGGSGREHSYGYIRANFFERIYIRGRIAGGDTGIMDVTGWRLALGPQSYRAQFIIRAKRKPKTLWYLHMHFLKKK